MIFPPKDRRVFVRPWIAIPLGIVVIVVGVPIIILLHVTGIVWLWDRIFEVADMGLPGRRANAQTKKTPDPNTD